MVVPVVGCAECDADKAHAVSLGAAYKCSAGSDGIAGLEPYAAVVFDEQSVVIIVGLVFYRCRIA